jgi:hypothetical protein
MTLVQDWSEATNIDKMGERIMQDATMISDPEGIIATTM